MKHYLLQILIALDQLGTALCGGFADETISSYLWRLDQHGKPAGRLLRPVVDALFFWQDDHCLHAYMAERARAQMPPELR